MAEPKIDRASENGIEIIKNHLFPYPVKSEPTDFRLDEELTINFGSPVIGELGIANATSFEVDSDGSIYFFYTNKEGNLIFKFDPQGRYVKSFGLKGQGPGEIQYIVLTGIDSRDNLIISDNGTRKILVFTKDGGLVKETRYPMAVGLIYPLENGNYFGLWNKHPARLPKSMYSWAFSLYDPEFKEIELLDTQDVYNFNTQGTRGVISRPFFKIKIGKGNVYIMSEERGYEILKYNWEGRLVQKIRKEFEPVEVSREVIAERTKRYERMGEKVWFPKYWLPLSDFFLDENGRIFAKTFEKGSNPGEYWYDIFDAGGVFIRRKTLNILNSGDVSACAKMRRNRLYCFQESEGGFNVFKVFRIVWE
ncbi:MAG: 6-bladed beta-propeller [Candidatus Aminicenantes bacterium]|nr:6-bladed beta-propeller [Candidatus Aminicenantes bacterium]